MASITDVAKKAGVGVSTVSKVLNNYANISQATRDKVYQAVDELNYVPNAIASALSSKNGKRIAVVVFINNKRQAIDEINMQYLFGTFEKAQSLGLEIVTVFSTVFENMSKVELYQYLKSLRVQSIIVYGLSKEHEQFKQLIIDDTLKMVIVDAPHIGNNTSYVMVDHQRAQYDIAKMMIENNETPVKKVLYLAGRRDGYVTDLRLQGVVDACSEYDVELNAQYSNFSESLAFTIVKEHAHDADIIICASDLMAIGATQALKEMDIFKPVCGYDGIKLLGYIGYEIKTVRQDFYDIAKHAVEAAKRLLDGSKGEVISLDYEITEIHYEDVIM